MPASHSMSYWQIGMVMLRAYESVLNVAVIALLFLTAATPRPSNIQGISSPRPRHVGSILEVLRRR